MHKRKKEPKLILCHPLHVVAKGYFSFYLSSSTPVTTLFIIHQILILRSRVTGILSADFFPLHLAISQLIFCLTIPVFFANQYSWWNNHWLDFITFLNVLVLTLKPLLHCLMCVDRYLAVVRPLDYQR